MENETPQTEKQRRPVTMLATLGIVSVALGSVGAIAYDAVVGGNGGSVTQLGTFATLAIGALIALSGGKKSGE